MADLILSPIADNIIGSLTSAAVREIATLWGLNHHLQQLQHAISIINPVLLHAEKKQAHNNSIGIWLRSLADAVHDADDLMDEFETEALRRQLMDDNGFAEKVCTFFSASNQLALRHKLGRRIQEIRKKLASASKDQSFLLLEGLSLDEKREVVPRRDTRSFEPKEELIGRDEDREVIVKLLLESQFEENLRVVPVVVGMAGLGKTALVKSVFDDERVQQYFEIKTWVCLSENFDLKFILQKLTNTSKEVELDQLRKDLRDIFSGKRYLLVLDDVREENREKWLELQNLLMCGAKGSKIVVTARSTTVASATSPTKPYHLGVLDKEESWALFKKMAFRHSEEKKISHLVQIGKEIVETCRGIPLVIRAIGSTLYSKHSESEWSSFANEISKISRGSGTILPLLRLSYDNLATHLKQCFAYCQLFPKDYKIKVRVLIQLWMAQGFLKMSDTSHDQCLEDVGYQCFVDLYEMSFFQEGELNKVGVVKSCKMHGLIHDLAVEVAGQEYATINWNSKQVDIKSVRHLSIDPWLDSDKRDSISFIWPRKIRTLFLLHGVPLKNPHQTSRDVSIPTFKQLRTLDLKNSMSASVPKCVSNLKHVRYLDLSKNITIRTLPNSITSLINLQTLKLKDCSELEELPRDMKNLINLRHLELDGCYRLRHMPVGLGRLSNLITLSKYVLPESSSSTVTDNGELRELTALNNLRGKLSISNLKQYNRAEVEFGILKEKRYLQSLYLEWDYTEEINESEPSLECFQPHPNLQKLYLDNYEGVKFPNWLPSLTHLVSLTVSCCGKCKLLCPLNQFHSLKKLKLFGLSSLEYIMDWNTDHNSSCSSPMLPLLQKLKLYDLPNLKGWWRDYDEANTHKILPSFHRLATLQIECCPALTCMPLFPRLEKLTLRNASLTPLRQTILESSFKDLQIDSSDLELSSVDDMIWKTLHERTEILELTDNKKLETPPEGLRHFINLQSLSFFLLGSINDYPGVDRRPQFNRESPIFILSGVEIIAGRNSKPNLFGFIGNFPKSHVV